MQKQKCSLKLYSNFLIANQNRYSGLELSRVSPIGDMHHDAVTRWLGQSDFTPAELWQKVRTMVDITTGYLICDDSLLSKKYSRQNELAKKQYSGNEHKLINGICLVNLLWTAGEEFVPIDYRIYQRENDHKTKNDHLGDMLKRAKKRHFFPKCVLIDAWYSSISNLKLVRRKLGWDFICNLKSNRQVSVRQGTYMAISGLDLADKQVKKVWLKEYGDVLVCKLVAKNGDVTYLATSDLSLTDYDDFTDHFENRWKIEEFHQAIKQTTGIERCSAIKSTSQQTHIFASFVAFIKLETRRLKDQVSWYEQKAIISRESTLGYLEANA